MRVRTPDAPTPAPGPAPYEFQRHPSGTVIDVVVPRLACGGWIRSVRFVIVRPAGSDGWQVFDIWQGGPPACYDSSEAAMVAALACLEVTHGHA